MLPCPTLPARCRAPVPSATSLACRRCSEASARVSSANSKRNRTLHACPVGPPPFVNRQPCLRQIPRVPSPTSPLPLRVWCAIHHPRIGLDSSACLFPRPVPAPLVQIVLQLHPQPYSAPSSLTCRPSYGF
ncbi:hypothetical protein L7F22_052579 [Adiantum nelumboides]|nr:hypothetical protein [Adiantum nelumboides]